MSSFRRCAIALFGGAVLAPTAPLRAFPAPFAVANGGAGFGLVPCTASAPRVRPAPAAVPEAWPVLANADSTLAALHASGQSFSDFVAAAKARRDGWLRLADSAQVDDALVQRARATGGSWKLLVVAVDACGDSMNTVPYVARLASQAGVDLRIVLPTAGRPVQEQHRSLDGRVATPTFVLLDAEGRERGCIVEQPRALREWSSAERKRAPLDSVHAGIRAFYAKDQGAAIARETVEMLEAAAAGRVHCDRGSAAS
jgi:hypothetical protein